MLPPAGEPGSGRRELTRVWPAGVEHEDVGIAGSVATEGGAEGNGAGGVVMLGVGGVLADVKGHDDEGFIDDGLIGGVVEEVVEHVAGAAPGGAEDEQDVFVLGGCGGAGFGEEVVGGGLSVKGGGKEERGGDEGGAEEGGGAHGAVEVSGTEVGSYFIMRWTIGFWMGEWDLCDRLSPC